MMIFFPISALLKIKKINKKTTLDFVKTYIIFQINAFLIFKNIL